MSRLECIGCYLATGDVLNSTNPNGQTSAFVYNTLGQPTCASMPSTTSTPAETIGYTYDTNGRTLSVSDNRGTTSMAYESGSDRVSSVTDPVTGPMTYTYLRSGEKSSVVSNDGQYVQNYSYYTPLAGEAGNPPDPFVGYSWSREAIDVLIPKDDPNSVSRHLLSITDGASRPVNVDLDTLGRCWATKYNQIYAPSVGLVSLVQDIHIPDGDIELRHGGRELYSPYPQTHDWLLRDQTTLYTPGSGTLKTSGSEVPAQKRSAKVRNLSWLGQLLRGSLRSDSDGRGCSDRLFVNISDSGSAHASETIFAGQRRAIAIALN